MYESKIYKIPHHEQMHASIKETDFGNYVDYELTSYDTVICDVDVWKDGEIHLNIYAPLNYSTITIRHVHLFLRQWGIENAVAVYKEAARAWKHFPTTIIRFGNIKLIDRRGQR